MRMAQRAISAIGAALLAACAGLQTAPSPEVRQALAPTGKLRVGLIDGARANLLRVSASGAMKGVGYDLGRELACRLGAPFEPIAHPSIAALLDAGKSAQWDVSFNGVTADRAQYLDFTVPRLEIELGYLVPGGSRISRFEDVDRPGVRVAVPEKGTADNFLSHALKNAEVVRGAGLRGALELVKSGKTTVFAASKPNLFEMSRQLPGSRVLEGRPGSETQVMLVPKGRDVAMAYARSFVEEAKSEGLVQAAIERAGLRGAVVVSAQ